MRHHTIILHNNSLWISLQQGGYQTAWVGKYHLGDDPKGFDFFKILVDQGRYFNPDFIIEGKNV